MQRQCVHYANYLSVIFIDKTVSVYREDTALRVQGQSLKWSQSAITAAKLLVEPSH